MSIQMERIIATELGIGITQVENTISLLDEGATVPFISRYRKEVTGSLDEEQVREIEKRMQYIRTLEERKIEVIRLIDEQDKLTPEIEQAIIASQKLQAVEAIYTPFKKKKKTKADIAIDNGLQPLSDFMRSKDVTFVTLEQKATEFMTEVIDSVAAALEGAALILAKEISEDLNFRDFVRNKMYQQGIIETKLNEKNKGKDEKSVYEIYYAYEEPIKKIPNHRILAINRAESEEIILVKQVILEPHYAEMMRMGKNTLSGKNVDELYNLVVDDSLQRLIIPSIEREIRNILTEQAEVSAVGSFEKNLKSLLMQPPMEKKSILGIDPGFRTGCKVVVIDSNGFFVENTTIYVLSDGQLEGAKRTLLGLLKKHHIDIIAIGNGTASRETESFVANLIASEKIQEIKYIIVSESGASVYSASPISKEEFPELDLTVRGAISIARRVQDPLAELVKIPPESIGVGMYQHDINKTLLSTALSGVVESCVNGVGANVNSASWALLGYVSGIKKNIAKNIVEHRKENGDFKDRKSLLKVKGLGAKAYEQAAGFLTILNGKNPLDATIIHPESYHIVELMLAEIGYKPKDLSTVLAEVQQSLSHYEIKKFIEKHVDYGIETVKDIYEALLKDRRDPRAEFPQPILKDHLLSIDDLAEGMIVEGTVRNVIDFGAFVDIGVKQDALLHISELSKRHIKNPLEVVSIGDIISVKIIGIDKKRGRVSLSRKDLA
ncbi:MAG: Tex family protein [Fusobacteria bacterium]|nr:Tex family protein [Fusobacteriota bacterium]